MEPHRLKLTDRTVELLNLSYAPYHWPRSGKFAFQGGFSIQEPSLAQSRSRSYASEQALYNELQVLLAPFQEMWVEADCTAAFIPDSKERTFSVLVNGVRLCSDLYVSPRLERRMVLLKMPILVTTCAARIVGGGRLRDGRKRGYGVFLDMKPFSRP